MFNSETQNITLSVTFLQLAILKFQLYFLNHILQ